jgi:hypothetical protein
MAGSVPDLIIPIRMDPSGATAQIAKVGAAGNKAGVAVAAGAAQGKRGLQDLQSGADSASHSLLALGRAQLTFATIKAVTGEIGAEFKRAADYVKEMSAEFAGLRKSMQELAALSGVSNENAFTVEQAKLGQKYGLSPEENRRFQEEFKNFAGSQVGDEKDAQGNSTGRVAKGAKLTEAQGEEFSGRIAAMMKTAGIDPALGAKLGGAMLQNAKGPQDVDKLMKDFQETFSLSQKGPVQMGEMLPQLARIMAHDISPQDAAKMFNVVAPAAPGEEGTSAEAAITAIQKMKNENKGEEFGVTRGMSDMESVRAFSENIAARKAKMVAEGATDKKAMDDLEALLAEKDLVADKREARGLIRGFSLQGIEKEGFTQYDEIQKNVPADFEQAEVKKYRESAQGRREATEIRKAVGRVESGAERAAIDDARETARAELIEEKAFEKPNVAGNMARAALGKISGVDPQEQLVNERALYEAERKLELSGGSKNHRYYAQGEEEGDMARAKTFAAVASQGEIDAELKTIFKEIAENTRRRQERAEQNPGVPLDAPRPQIPGRPGG